MIAHLNSGCGVRLRLMSGPSMRRTQSLTMDFFRFGALHLDRIFDGPTPVEVDESHCQRICDFLSAVDQQHACSCANLFLQDPRAPFADCLREANSEADRPVSATRLLFVRRSAQFLESGLDLSPSGFAGMATRAVRRMQSEQG